MAEPKTLDPRLEELLREVAADPASTLLRVPRPARLSSLHEHRPAVGIATAGLSAAERELVRAHRSELALLLRELAVSLLFRDPAASTCRIRACTTRRDHRVYSIDECRARGASALQAASEDGQAIEGLALLRECVLGGLDPARATVAEVCAASIRIEPTDQAQIYLALEACSNGDMGAAESLLQRVLAGPASRINRAAAQVNMGWIESRRVALDLALNWYRCATESQPDFPVGPMSWLAVALEAESRPEVEAAAWAVDSSLSARHSAATEFAQVLARQLAAGTIIPSNRARKMASALAERRESAAGVIAHVLA